MLEIPNMGKGSEKKKKITELCYLHYLSSVRSLETRSGSETTFVEQVKYISRLRNSAKIMVPYVLLPSTRYIRSTTYLYYML